MSQPKFPDINPDMTKDCALNMILASIAMEELALSHIVNAEGEKLQYVLGTLNNGCGKKPNVDEILAVNKSITQLLEVVSENEIILKNKMEKVLRAMSDECQEKPELSNQPCGCREKCSASFKGPRSKEIWNAGCSLPWICEHIHGKCIVCNQCDNTKITIVSKGRFMVNFAVNVKSLCNAECGASISLRMLNANRRSDIFTYHCPLPESNLPITVSAGGIIVETPNNCATLSLLLELDYPDFLTVDHSKLSIVEL